jgi:chemotaxis response regulator CheB
MLSGSGTDGAKGIQAVKQAGGITFAQDESFALFYGMPTAPSERHA